MISLSKLDGREVVVSCDHILTIERTPDTVITLTTGDRLMVKETVEDVVARVVAFKQRVMAGPSVAETGQG